MSNPIYLPDGSIAGQDTIWLDKTQTYANEGEQFQITPKELLMAAARMQRDGKSLKQIRVELDLSHAIGDQTLQRALNLGHDLLDKAISKGAQPEESKVEIDASAAPLNVNEDL